MKQVLLLICLIVSVGVLKGQDITSSYYIHNQAETGYITQLSDVALKYTLKLRSHSANGTSFYFGQGNSGATQIIQSANTTGATAYALSINPFGGNVGIGTANPQSKFEINTGGTQLRLQGDQGVFGININVNTTGGWARNFSFSSNGGVRAHIGAYGGNNTLTYLYFDSNDELDALGYTNPEMVINKNGDVGIGLTSPVARFEVFDEYSGSSDNFRVQYSPSLGGMVIGDNEAKLSISTKVFGGAASKTPGGAFIVLDHANESVGIGTSTPGAAYKLAVEGRIGARSIKVTSASWADYVFTSNYVLMPLSEVETYIKSNGHLPEVPPALEVEQNGFVLEEMDALMMRKIEELTLYTIQQQQEIDALKEEVEVKALQLRLLEEMEKRLNALELKQEKKYLSKPIKS